METSIDRALDDLGVRYGRLAVRDGYADGAIRVWTPTAAHFHIHPDGTIAQKASSSRSDIDWSYSA